MAYKDREKQRAYKRQWREANREHVRASARALRAKKLDEIRAYDRKWKRARRKTHGDTVRAASRDYFATRPEQRRTRAERSRAWRAMHPERVKILNQEYNATHQEKITAVKRRWVVANIDRLKVHRREYRLKNLARIRANYERWKQQNPGADLAHALNRRARKLGSGGDGITVKQWEELCAATGYRCAYCLKKFSLCRLTRDHISPIGEGPDSLHNIIPACQTCNTRKRRGPVPRPVQPFLLTIAPAKKRKGKKT